VLCSQVFRNSVPSSIPPRKSDAGFRDVTCEMLAAELVRWSGGFGPSGRARFMGEFLTSRERGARRTGADPDHGPDGRPVRVIPGRLTFRGRADRTMRDPEVVVRAARNGVSDVP
jgi:hypothetical protein